MREAQTNHMDGTQYALLQKCQAPKKYDYH